MKHKKALQTKKEADQNTSIMKKQNKALQVKTNYIQYEEPKQGITNISQMPHRQITSYTCDSWGFNNTTTFRYTEWFNQPLNWANG